MKKSYWSGFLSGIVCTLLCAVIGVNVYHIVLNRSLENNRIALQEDTDEAERTHISAVNVLAKVTLLERYIDTYYLNDVNAENLEEGVFKGILAGLSDPYSVYYTKDEYTSLQESTSGIYCGIGARVSQNIETGIITIIEPFENGPAYEAGILPEDIVYMVEGHEVTGEDISEVVARMKGEEGTQVDLTIVRDGEEKEFTLTRRQIETPTVEYEMLEDKIGYIKVSEFDEVTGQQFRSALNDLEKEGQKGLVIDLRNNGGGRLTAAVDMLDRMLPEGIIVTTQEKSGEGETYTSTETEKFEKPLTVLINGHSASASEVFAGAIQDYGTGKLVGTTSFGKGIVQTIFDLKDGTAVKLTTSEYFTPSGRNIHGSGLDPDIEVELKESLSRQVKIDKSKDNQLKAAMDQIKKEIVE